MKKIILSAILFALSLGVSAQDSGPKSTLINMGYRTESYNLRFAQTGSLTSASASYQITIPVSEITIVSNAVASISFSADGDTSSAVWEALPANTVLRQKYEAASGSYLMIRGGASPARFHFFAVGRQNY